MHLCGRIDFRFSSTRTLAPGEFLVLVKDAATFESRYPGTPIGGVYGGKLANGGEEIRLRDVEGATIISVAYDDDGFWPIGPDGFGYSLVIVAEDRDPDVAASWRASARVHGSPGEPDPVRPPAGVVINEVLANSAPPLEDAIELFNPTPRSVDVGGWFLSDRREDAASLKKLRIADGTVIAAGGYAVFYENQLNPLPGTARSLELAPGGGEVYLTATNGQGELTGFIIAAEYGAEDSNRSFGRFTTSAGAAFATLGDHSFGVDAPSTVEEFRSGTGNANGPPAVGPVVINEVMYHPEVGREEFVELFNPTAAPISLFSRETGRGWRLSGIQNIDETDSLEFMAGTEIPARGFLLVVGIDPDVFRGLHAVPFTVPVVGAFGGGLDNSGERLKLSRPAHVAGALEYVLVALILFSHFYNVVRPCQRAARHGRRAGVLRLQRYLQRSVVE